MVQASLYFFLGNYDNRDEELQEKKEDNLKTIKDLSIKSAMMKHSKRTKKTMRMISRTTKKLRKAGGEQWMDEDDTSDEEKLEKKYRESIVAPISLLYDPQSFAERLFGKLRGSGDSFDVRLMLMNVISKAIAHHKLLVLNYYPFLQKYLQPHQRHVTQILAFLARACHALVPPEVLQPVVSTLANHFVTDRSTPEVMTVGINAIREICLRTPLALSQDLVRDLVQYRKSKNKGVFMAARAFLAMVRQVAPGLLMRKDFGRAAAVAMQAAQGEEDAAAEEDEDEEDEDDEDDEEVKKQKRAVKLALKLQAASAKAKAKGLAAEYGSDVLMRNVDGADLLEQALLLEEEEKRKSEEEKQETMRNKILKKSGKQGGQDKPKAAKQHQRQGEDDDEDENEEEDHDEDMENEIEDDEEDGEEDDEEDGEEDEQGVDGEAEEDEEMLSGEEENEEDADEEDADEEDADEEDGEDEKDDEEDEDEEEDGEEDGEENDKSASSTVKKPITAVRLLTPEDFKKIEELKKLRQEELLAGKRKRFQDKKEEQADEAINANKEVEADDIEGSYQKKRRLSKAERLESVMEGREGRIKYGHKLKDHTHGSTNQEKLKTKAFMMVKQSRKVKAKVTKSFKDKQSLTKDHLKSLRAMARNKRTKNKIRSKKH
jgi:protein SDA1